MDSGTVETVGVQTGTAVATGGTSIPVQVGAYIGQKAIDYIKGKIFGSGGSSSSGSSFLGYDLPPHLGTRLIAVIAALILLTIVAIRLTIEE